MTKWDTMTPRERDELIHTEVMKRQVKMCEAKLWGPEDVSQIIVRCGGCGHEFSDDNITSIGDHGPDVIPIFLVHNEPIPHYTTDMDAAWQVLRHLFKQLRIYGPTETQRPATTHFVHWFEQANLWSMDSQRAALAICKAALDAVGWENGHKDEMAQE